MQKSCPVRDSQKVTKALSTYVLRTTLARGAMKEDLPASIDRISFCLVFVGAEAPTQRILSEALFAARCIGAGDAPATSEFVRYIRDATRGLRQACPMLTVSLLVDDRASAGGPGRGGF